MSRVRRTSIKDIAKETNLSISTISRIMNGKAKKYRIGKKSEKLVLETAKKLNYKADYAAASLRSGKSKSIALLVPSLSNPFFANMSSKIIEDLRKEGYITFLGESNENLENEMDFLQNLQHNNISGLIIVPSGVQNEHIVHLREQGLPVICFDRYYEDSDLPYVATDNYDGAYKATKFLIKNGHHHISVIQGVHTSVPNKQRIKGFNDAMRDSGLKNINISGDAYSIQNGYLETKLILQESIRPTAIFSLSNTIALGCLKALKEEKLQIPEDISLIAFDDHPFLDFLATPLTCVVQPEIDIAKLAIRILFSIIDEKNLETQQMLLKPYLKIRESVKRI